jgi:hypothetical protein
MSWSIIRRDSREPRWRRSLPAEDACLGSQYSTATSPVSFVKCGSPRGVGPLERWAVVCLVVRSSLVPGARTENRRCDPFQSLHQALPYDPHALHASFCPRDDDKDDGRTRRGRRGPRLPRRHPSQRAARPALPAQRAPPPRPLLVRRPMARLAHPPLLHSEQRPAGQQPVRERGGLARVHALARRAGPPRLGAQSSRRSAVQPARARPLARGAVPDHRERAATHGRPGHVARAAGRAGRVLCGAGLPDAVQVQPVYGLQADGPRVAVAGPRRVRAVREEQPGGHLARHRL